MALASGRGGWGSGAAASGRRGGGPSVAAAAAAAAAAARSIPPRHLTPAAQTGRVGGVRAHSSGPKAVAAAPAAPPSRSRAAPGPNAVAAWMERATAALLGGGGGSGGDRGLAAILEAAGGAAALRSPPPHAFAEAICAAASRAAPSLPPAAAARLAAALGAARVPAPPQLRAALAARVEAGAWELSAAALAEAAAQFQRDGHVWSVPAAWAFVARAAAAVRVSGRGAQATAAAAAQQQQQQQEAGDASSAAPLEAAAVAELLLALRPALQQARRGGCEPRDGGSTSRDDGGSTAGGGGGGGGAESDAAPADLLPRGAELQGHVALLWRHGVDAAERAVDAWLQHTEGGVSGGEGGGGGEDGGAPADPVPSVLALLQALQALPELLRADARSERLLRASRRATRACALPQIVPLLAAWRALGIGGAPPAAALLRIARQPLTALSSAKLAALGAALGGTPPSARGARGAAAAVASEAMARATAGRLPAPAAAQLAAALPHLLRLGWPADAAAALLAVAEAGVGALAPAQLWELRGALEVLEPLWPEFAATATRAWCAGPPAPAGSDGGEGAGEARAGAAAAGVIVVPGSDGQLRRPVYPGPPVDETGAGPTAGAARAGRAAPLQPDGPIAAVPAPRGAAPGRAAAERLQSLRQRVDAALSAVPAERLPLSAAPPALPGGLAADGDGGSGGRAGPLSARRQALAALLRARGVLAAPGLTPDDLAAACAGLARLFGAARIRGAALREARERAATQRALEAAAWVWMQRDGAGGDDAVAPASAEQQQHQQQQQQQQQKQGREPADQAAQPGWQQQGQGQPAEGGGALLDGVALALILRALVDLGADPREGVAARVAAAAHGALSRLPPRELAAALRRLAALRLPRRRAAWGELMLRLLAGRVVRMEPQHAVDCAAAMVLGLGFRPAPGAIALLLPRLLAPGALAALRPLGLIELARLLGALRAAGTARSLARAAPGLLPPAALAPVLGELARRMHALNGRQLVALGAAVAGWGVAPGALDSEWLQSWLGLVFVRLPELPAEDVVRLQLLLADFDLMPDPAAWRHAGAQARLQAALARRADWRAPLRAELERRFALTHRAAGALQRLLARRGAAAAREAPPAPRRGAGPGMAARVRHAAPRAAAVDAQRQLMFARQRVVWAALRHGVVALTPTWAARCMMLLGPLLPRVNAQVAAALLRACAAARPDQLRAGAVGSLAERAVVCCIRTRGPLLLELLSALAAASSTQAGAPLVCLTARQQRFAVEAVLRGCADMSPAQQARALELLAAMGVPQSAGHAAWLGWLCRGVLSAAAHAPLRVVAAAVGLLTAAAWGALGSGGGSSSRGGPAASPSAPSALDPLLPALHAALARLAVSGGGPNGAAAGGGALRGLGAQRLAALAVALAVLQADGRRRPHSPPRLGGGGGMSSRPWQVELGAEVLARLAGQFNADAAGGGRAWRRACRPIARGAMPNGAPQLPGPLALQLAAALPAVAARPPAGLRAALSQRLAGIGACGLAPPRALRGIWARGLASELAAAAAAAAALSEATAAAAAAAAEAERVAAGLRAAAAAAALVATPPLPRGAVRRLRTGGARKALLRRLAALELWEREAADASASAGRGAGALAPLRLLPAAGSGFGGLGPALGLLPGSAPAPLVLSSLLELRFARLVTNVVLPTAAGEAGRPGLIAGAAA
ncbi:hypothetical protein Rsub_08012 [Raphidocelis subcapitata]|uniref:Uncharacterized protein n=1 Tax=Raphidocelis subcapitata TaxID=307507 RepID=A0A2V0PAE8_9CHLO|nr:hypothetical protein Rsub_08012 [Raphidocelis subcapitata]|eukprot:GBF94840.1 hypothetical protein Rsub_08012 [Raphidocelis subcapitata]